MYFPPRTLWSVVSRCLKWLLFRDSDRAFLVIAAAMDDLNRRDMQILMNQFEREIRERKP